MIKSSYQAVIDILKQDKSTDEVLDWAIQNGQSLILDWGEDNNLWECSWISGGGKRYTSFEKTARQGVRECIKKMAQVELNLNRFQFMSLEDY